MKVVKSLVAACVFAAVLAGCGTGDTPLTGTKTTERGESSAVNPARNVYVSCESKQNQTSVTTNIINNCNKNNAPAAEEEAVE